MTPYILESNVYSKVTMKAYGRLNTDYTAITKIQGTARGDDMPEIPPNNDVIYSWNMDAYAGRQQQLVGKSLLITIGRSFRWLSLRGRATTRDDLPGWWPIEEMKAFAMDLHDPWAWGDAASTSSDIKGARAATDDPDAIDNTQN